MEENNKIIVFQEKSIRRVWHNDEWYFSIVDVVEVLTSSPIPRTYWSKLKAKILAESELNPIWVQLKMVSADRKNYKTDATNTEGMFRIIQSIPSPKWYQTLNTFLDNDRVGAECTERFKVVFGNIVSPQGEMYARYNDLNDALRANKVNL